MWLFWFFVAELLQPPGGGKVKSAIAQPGQPTKKKRPRYDAERPPCAVQLLEKLGRSGTPPRMDLKRWPLESSRSWKSKMGT